MKAKLTGIFLCIGAFILSMVLLMNLIENPMRKTPDFSPSSPSSEQGTGAPDEKGGEDVSSGVTSIEGVMSVAKETQEYFSALASDAVREVPTADAMCAKWHNAAVFLRSREADEAGALYYEALENAVKTYTGSLPATAAEFSEKAGAALNTLKAAAITEEEPTGRYPAVSTSENGAFALSLARLWRAAQKSADSVTVSFGGEVAMGDFLGSSDYQNRYAVENAPNPLAALAPVFSTDDLSLVTLDSPLTTYTVPEVAATEAFRGSAVDVYAKHLKNAGVDVVSLASCHISDFGETGYNDTKTALEKAGLIVAEDGAITYVTLPAGKTAVITHNLVGKGGARFTEIPKAQIAEARQNGATFVVVYFHLGAEEITAAMADTLRDAAANGANLVLSSHTDSIRGILLSEENKTPLLFSPGRLSYASSTSASRDAYLYSQKFTLSAEAGVTAGERMVFALNNHCGDGNAPTLYLDSENTGRIASTLSAALPTFEGRPAAGDLSVISISK